MKTLISTRSAFFAAALVIPLSFGCGDATEGEAGSSTLGLEEASNGQCNAIVANSLRTAQECQRISCEPGSDQCVEAFSTLVEFVSTPGCLEAFGNEDLNGLPGNASVQPAGPNAGATKHIGLVICEAIEGCERCGEALSFGICVETCTPTP